MRTNHSYHPDFGASPEPVFEYDLDAFTAGQMLRAAERVRKLTEAYAAAVAAELSANDLWAEEYRPPTATHGASTDAVRAQRFRSLLDELVDEQMHQGKLEEAGELA